MENYSPKTAMESEAGRGHVMESQVLLSPAILWGILISEFDQSRLTETNEADHGWTDAASRKVEIDEDIRDTESDGDEEPVAELGARRDLSWGSREWEIPSQATSNDGFPLEAKALDREATNKLWNAAGYNVEATTEGSEDASAMRDATVINDDDDEPTEIYQPPSGPYNIKKADGKGQGVYASQDIPRGTRILVDKPFFAVTKPYNLSTIIDKFEQMSFTNRKLYMQFSCPDRPDDKRMSDVTRIFQANCFNIDYSAAIFQTATRFNHSCLPNTYYSWSEARQELVFQAMVDVEEEEELTIAYGRAFLSHRERKMELRNYNFKCKCPACQLDTPFGQASESRRLVMKALDEQIAMCQTALNEGLLVNDLENLLSLILTLVELVEEEGLRGELMAPYRGATELLKGRGDWEGAMVFAKKQLEEERTCLGEDSEVTKMTRELAEALEGMTGRKGGLEEGKDLDKTEPEVQDMESTKHHDKEIHSQTPPPKSPNNPPPTTITLEDCPYPKSLSPSPPSRSSSPHPPPLLHLPPTNKTDPQTATALLKNKQLDPEPHPQSSHSSSAEAHSFSSEEYKDETGHPHHDADSKSSSPRLGRGKAVEG